MRAGAALAAAVLVAGALVGLCCLHYQHHQELPLCALLPRNASSVSIDFDADPAPPAAEARPHKNFPYRVMDLSAEPQVILPIYDWARKSKIPLLAPLTPLHSQPLTLCQICIVLYLPAEGDGLLASVRSLLRQSFQQWRLTVAAERVPSRAAPHPRSH